MPGQCVSDLAVGQVPHLNGPVPGGGDDGWLERVGAESHARDPVVVPVLLLDGVLALAKGIPKLNRAVAGGGHDLTVVNGEGHGEHVLGVTHKAAGGDPGLEIPEAELTVPGAGESELAVG